MDDDGQIQSQIVVGSQGKVADVVGAINIGASVGQAAVQTTEETVPGQETSEVDGEEYEIDIRGGTVTQGWIDASDYSQLQRATVQDSDGNDHRVLEQIGVQANAGTSINESDVHGDVAENAVQYQVSYTPGFGVGEAISVLGEEYEITDIDQDSDNNNRVKLGSKMEETGLELGDSYQHGPYTIEVVDKDESSSAIYVQISKDGEVLKARGLESGKSFTVDNEALNITATDVFFGSQRDYIDVETVYTDTEVVDGEESPFDEDYTVNSLSGTFTGNDRSVTGLTLASEVFTSNNPENTDNEDDINHLEEGEAIDGPQGYFSLTYQGLTSEQMEEASFEDGYVVSFTDFKGFDQTIDLNEGFLTPDDETTNTASSGYEVPDSTGEVRWVDVAGRPVKVEVTGTDGTNGNEVELSYETWSATVTTSGLTEDSSAETGYGFSVDATLTADSDDDGADGPDLELTSVSATEAPDGETPSLTNGQLDLTDADGENDFDTENEVEITPDVANTRVAVNEDRNVDGTTDTTDDLWVHYGSGNDDAEITEVDDDNKAGEDTDSGSWLIDSENTDTISNFGTVVNVGADMATASLDVPEAQRQAQYALGSVTTTSGGDQTYRAIDADAQGQLPSMAMLDSDVQESHKANNHLILVGGPAVNTLVADLVDDGAVDLSELEGQGSGALIQGVSDAFADGQHALVVAGVEADDTRSAAQYISNYRTHQDRLSDDGDRVVLQEADYPSEQ